MLNAKAFANASAAATLLLYIVCRVVSFVAPDFLFDVARSWFHTFSVDSLRGVASMDMGTFLFGGVSMVVLVWVTTYVTIVLYNRWAK
jgi:hypothetical protein